MRAAFGTYQASFDREYGGFGRAPKFPMPASLELLLRYARRTREPERCQPRAKTLGDDRIDIGNLNGIEIKWKKRGEGRVSGTLLGALLIAVLRNGSNLLGVDPFDQNIYIGLLIIGAVAFDQKLRKLG